jgi:hypothetical protein
MSDLHLEFGGIQIPVLETDPTTLLVLAGDIHVKDKVIPFLKEMATRFPLVAVVMGNHEHYRSSVDLTGNKIKKGLQQEGLTNVHLLDNEVLEINGYRIIGGTMWTDLNRGDPISMWTCQQGINDYKYIRHSNYGRKFHPNVCITEHLKFKSFLQEELAKDYDGQYIVVTHHAPHDMSIDPHYANQFHLNGQYRSDLSELILDNSKIKMWIHGHIHCNSNYDIGQCRVICNPRGYVPKWLNDDFNPNLVIQL